MSVRISVIQTVEVPARRPLAICANGQVELWPEGVGCGPCIFMSLADWAALAAAADRAVQDAGRAERLARGAHGAGYWPPGDLGDDPDGDASIDPRDT